MHPRALVIASVLAAACAEDDTQGDPVDTGAGLEVPVRASEILPWLEDGSYLDWMSESLIHESLGPHFGDVRTYLNNPLFDSLEAGNGTHPRDAAAVKELYGEGTTVRGWAVWVKFQDDSAGGDGFYWYEYFDDAEVAEGGGVPICVGCHSGSERDFLQSQFPLQ